MGSSFVEYRERGFWSRDDYLEHFMAELADAASHAGTEQWLREAAKHWLDQSEGSYCGFMHPHFDEFLATDNRRDMALGLIESIAAEEDATRELRETCALAAKLLCGELDIDASSPSNYIVRSEGPYCWKRKDPWCDWRDGKSSRDDSTVADDTPIPPGSGFYIADVLYARPATEGAGGYRQELCHRGIFATSPADAYQHAIAWGRKHAAEAPGEVRLLGASHLWTIRGGRKVELLSAEQLAEIARLCKEVWLNGIDD
jgi:hypothetical protein